MYVPFDGPLAYIARAATNNPLGIALAAQTECAISKATASGTRPSVADTARDLNVSDRLPDLAAEIQKEQNHTEDRFQAKVSAGWLYWVVGDYREALEALPGSMEDEGISEERADSVSEWTNLCSLKAAYLRANCLMRDGQRTEALAALTNAIPSLNSVWCGHGVRKQMRYWSELFLTEYCMLSSQAMENDELNLDDPRSVAGFRNWAKYWDIMGAPVTGGFGFKGSVPRRRIWAEYYDALSRILDNDLPYVPGHVDKVPEGQSPRGELRYEIKQTEAAYRALILTENSFPRADEEREEIEDFVKKVMKNWSILCGRGWRVQDLGQGGRAALSRGVLETLYSAATRTYHSTAILRSLFSVHLSLGEFELAFKAFDSYLEIVRKSKARVEKTGHDEPSLDDDGTVIGTMAQAVTALCHYGHQSAGERARQLGAELEDWLAKLPQQRATENGRPSIAEEAPRNEAHQQVAPHVVALAWQAIGLSHAHWSRITPEAASRTEIQSKAIRCLRKSLGTEFGCSKDIRSFFSLALLLAERRELTAAIELVRTALLSNKGQEESYSLFHGSYWQERALIPVWHLLALLLSARQDFALASRACDGALEQFKDTTVLFGKTEQSFRSEHLNESEMVKEKDMAAPAPRGLVDDMEDSEKESLLEVKMTQLVLIETVEGPDAAVNSSHELLSLFHRLFGTISSQPSPSSRAATLSPQVPKTSGSRSIRGSIFGGRTDKSKAPTRQVSMVGGMNERPGTLSGALPSRPATSTTAGADNTAPAILVTNDGATSGSASMAAGTLTSQRSMSRTRNSLRKRNRSTSRPKQPTASGTALQQDRTVVDGEGFYTPTAEADRADFFTGLNEKPPQIMAPAFTRGNTVSSLQSVLSATSNSTDMVAALSADGTHASPSLLPLVQFSKEKERTQKIGMLIKIWLTIAGFYRRAGLLDEAKGCVAEAQKLLQSADAEEARDPASGGARVAAWAERKSIDDLWGDLWAEVSPDAQSANETRDNSRANRRK